MGSVDFFIGLLFCVGLWFVVRFTLKIPATPAIKIIFGLLFAFIVFSFAIDSLRESNSYAITAVQVIIAASFVFVIASHLVFAEETDSSKISVSESPVITQNPVATIKSSPLYSQTTATLPEYFSRSYHWTYGGRSPTYVLKIPESLYQYYRNQHHNRNYVKYAISEKDRYILRDLVSDFKENTNSNTEAAHQVVAFVQSIPYSTDYISTGYNDYPRYPIETLVDGSGDCEDTAILTAALLKEMNYDVVLLSPPGHMAIGITCPACKGTSITIDNKKYYYLETTASGWEVGQLPPEYRNDQVRYYRI